MSVLRTLSIPGCLGGICASLCEHESLPEMHRPALMDEDQMCRVNPTQLLPPRTRPAGSMGMVPPASAVGEQ